MLYWGLKGERSRLSLLFVPRERLTVNTRVFFSFLRVLPDNAGGGGLLFRSLCVLFGGDNFLFVILCIELWHLGCIDFVELLEICVCVCVSVSASNMNFALYILSKDLK